MTSGALTDLQLAVMNVMWRLGQATVSEVVHALEQDGRILAPTTVATLLQRLSKQGWIEATKLGRNYVYKPSMQQREAATTALRSLVRGFFGGSPVALTAQLLESDALTDDDLAEMRRLDDLRIGQGDFTDKGLLYLESLKALRFLYLTSENAFSKASLQRLRRSLPNLQTLNVVP